MCQIDLSEEVDQRCFECDNYALDENNERKCIGQLLGRYNLNICAQRLFDKYKV